MMTATCTNMAYQELLYLVGGRGRAKLFSTEPRESPLRTSRSNRWIPCSRIAALELIERTQPWPRYRVTLRW